MRLKLLNGMAQFKRGQMLNLNFSQQSKQLLRTKQMRGLWLMPEHTI